MSSTFYIVHHEFKVGKSEQWWETTQHISEINTVIKAPKNICKKLGLDEKSCW